jgi:hypothetical protein
MKALLVAALIALAPAAALARPGLDAVIGPDGVTITDSEKPVLFYRTKPINPSAEPGRLNYVHPLYAPDGTILTEDRPTVLPEQRGVFWGWRQVRLGGDLVADGWALKGLTYFVKQTNFDGEAGGAGVLTLQVDWIVDSGPELVFVAREVTKVRILPLKAGARRLEFDTTVTALIDDLSLGGSEDAKGYGGFAMRLAAPAGLAFSSGGKAIAPSATPVAAANSMGFSWPKQPGLSKWAVGLSCKANGKALTQWILRRESSMQNCAWPGRAMVALPKGQSIRLQSTLVIVPGKGK